MNKTTLDEIVIENRIRRSFDPKTIEKLKDSILTKGLMHPPVLRAGGHLVAGERRLRAIRQIYEDNLTFRCNGQEFSAPDVPYTEFESLHAEALLEAELEENICRADLTWQEVVDAQAKLHDLRLAQHGSYHRTTNPDGQTLTKTAQEIVGQDNPGGAIKEVSDSLILARHLDDADIRQAATRAEALKLLKAKARDKLTSMLSTRADRSTSRHRLIHGDFFQDKSIAGVDVLCTDPPYGTDADTFGSQVVPETRHSYDDSYHNWRASMLKLAATMQTAAFSARAHAYIFVAFKNYHELQEIISAAHWRVWHRPLIWDKGVQGILPEPDYGPRYTHDYILYAIRGKKPVRLVANDVINVPQGRYSRRAAEKAPELYVNLLQRSAEPGSLVWDPFCGTGPIFPAANKLDLRAIGHDIDEKAIAIAKIRMNEEIESA